MTARHNKQNIGNWLKEILSFGFVQFLKTHKQHDGTDLCRACVES